MQEELETIKMLSKKGKLDKRLIWRMAVLFVMAIITFGILLYDIFWQNLRLLPAIGFMMLGFILAYFIFMRMNKVEWDQNREIITMGRFDLTTITLLVIFVLYRVAVNEFLEGHYQDGIEISGFSLATFFGGIIGRLSGTFFAIHRTHKENK